MTTAHLISLFGLGCAANSFFFWLAAVHPVGASIAKSFYFLLILLALACLVLDSAIYRFFHIDQIAYYAIWALAVLSVALGAGVVWLS